MMAGTLDAEVLRCQVDSLRDALRKVLDTREKEASAWMTYQNARENFSGRGQKEGNDHQRAMTAASNAEKEARLLLATLKAPNARLTGPNGPNRSSHMAQNTPAVLGPVESSVGRLDRERADFEAWAAEQWGKEAWRHMSGTSGEWEAYRAGVMAAEAQWERALRLAWNMVDPLRPAGQPGSYARGQDAGIVAALKTVRENLMAVRKTPN